MTSFRINSEMRTCCFVNPFANHSYFTLRALVQSVDLAIFCPPLQLQLLFRRWNTTNLSFVDLPLLARLANFLCVFAFLSFRFHFISHSFYLRVFKFLLIQYLDSFKACRTFVFYQDYVSDLLAKRYPCSLRICELIISTDPTQANYDSTVASIDSSSITVLPTPKLADSFPAFQPSFVVAPYGGNKADYYPSYTSLSDSSTLTSCDRRDLLSSSQTIRIIARSNSFRKGADVLFGALPLLDSLLSSSGSLALIDVLVCGSISEPALKSEFHRLVHHLSGTHRVSIKCKQLSQFSFSQKLAISDLFVMPSRLESTSLAALEALWHGLPSILTPECGVDDFVDARHGILLPDHDSLSLANAILSFCLSPAKLTCYRNFLVQDRALFSWNRYFKAYRELFESTCLAGNYV
jgi:glycosyltransferase involved in cell wall biosynthesis